MNIVIFNPHHQSHDVFKKIAKKNEVVLDRGEGDKLLKMVELNLTDDRKDTKEDWDRAGEERIKINKWCF